MLIELDEPVKHLAQLAARLSVRITRAMYGRKVDVLLRLRALGERTGAVADNLDRAEKLGVLDSANKWLEIRQTCNQMIHEYIESPQVLADAINTAHGYEETLVAFALAMLTDAEQRNLLE